MPSTLNLLIQLIITSILSLGILYVRKRKIIPHGYATLTAVILNALSIVVVMLPSALRIMSGASMNIFTFVVVAHLILGTLALILGVYLMSTWRMRKPGESCFRIANYMKPLAIAWIFSTVIGVYIYFLLL